MRRILIISTVFIVVAGTALIGFLLAGKSPTYGPPPTTIELDPKGPKLVASGDYSSDPQEAAKQRGYEALNMMNNHNLEGAMKNLDDMIKIDPNEVMAYVLKAEIYARQKEWDKADENMTIAIRLRPENPLVQMNVADMKMRRGQYDEARTRYQAVTLSPANTDFIAYKIFLCDLAEKKDDLAQQELTGFADQSSLGYLFSHAAWAINHGTPEEVQTLLKQASGSHSRQAMVGYLAPLDWIGYLPQLKAITAPSGN